MPSHHIHITFHLLLSSLLGLSLSPQAAAAAIASTTAPAASNAGSVTSFDIDIDIGGDSNKLPTRALKGSPADPLTEDTAYLSITVPEGITLTLPGSADGGVPRGPSPTTSGDDDNGGLNHPTAKKTAEQIKANADLVIAALGKGYVHVSDRLMQSEEEVKVTDGTVVSFMPDVKGVVRADFRLEGVKEDGKGQAMCYLTGTLLPDTPAQHLTLHPGPSYISDWCTASDGLRSAGLRLRCGADYARWYCANRGTYGDAEALNNFIGIGLDGKGEGNGGGDVCGDYIWGPAPRVRC